VSFARLWAICRHDLSFGLRRPLTWIWIALVALCAIGLASGDMSIQAGDSATGGLRSHITSAFNNAFELSILGGLFYVFFVAVISGMAVIRDGETRIEGLLHSTPLRPSEYVWGKALAALIGAGVILGLQLVLGSFFKHVVTGDVDPDIVGDFSVLNYLQPALLFCVPLIVFTAGVAFAIGERTRRPVLVNFFPMILLLLSIFLLWMWNPAWLDPRIDRAMMLVDPTGFRWLKHTWLDVDRGAEFYNSARIGFDGGFYLSRLILVLIGLGAFFSSQLHLARSLRGARVSRRKVERALAKRIDEGPRPFTRRRPLGDLRMSRRRPRFISAVSNVARIEFGILAAHPGVWLFLPLLVLNATFDAIYSVGAFDTPLLLTPGRSAVGSLEELTFTLLMLLMFFTVEGLHREKNTGVGAITYSTPLSNRALILGKLLAVSVLGLLPIVAVFTVCALLILVEGKVPLDMEPYGIVFGLLIFPVVIFWNAFMAIVQALTRNRGASYAIGLAAMISVGILYVRGGLSWVWNWSLTGALRWTDMGPFEMDRIPLTLNRLMVLGAALFFFILTARIFPRRGFDATRTVLRLRPGALVRTALVLLPWALAPLALGIALQKGVNRGPDGVRFERWEKNYWSKNVRTWLDTPNPDITEAEVELELRPRDRWLHSTGEFELTSPHLEPLSRIALTGAPHWQDVAWTLNGVSVVPEDREGLYVFDLRPPLREGESCRIGFAFQGTFLDGYSKNGAHTAEFILEAGVVLTSFSPSFAPVVGFQEGIGVDEDNRYDSREFPDDFFEGETPAAFGPAVPHRVKMTITAPAEYTMNSVGVKTGDFTEDGLRTVTWESDQPVRFFNVVGGRWDVRRGEGTAIYHHPAHTYNLDEMIEALDGARRFYSEWFHPFPWEELRVSEFASYAGYAQGFPTNITFSEEIGFLVDGGDERSNPAFFVTAHEAAHQWWGNLLMPGDGPGGNLLSEGMADLSTILLIGEIKGPRRRIEFCKRLEGRYLEGRSIDSERPLVWIDGTKKGDGVLTYEKMAWASWMLMDHMGREECLTGLRSFIDHYLTSRDHPVIQDFLTHLRPFASDADAYDAFTRQWFFEKVLPEYQLEEVSFESDAGRARLRLRNSGTGTMPIEVSAERGERFAEVGEDPFLESRVTVTVGPRETTEVVIPCDFTPDRIVIDPDARVLQLGRERAIHRY
jgi:ABC-2 type transport system permease protein